MKIKPIKIRNIRVKKTNLNRIKIPIKIRTSVLVILAILALSSLYSAYAVTGEGATTIEKSIPTCNYLHNGNFDYTAYLHNNTVYNFTTIRPGQATIFKKITDYLDVSFDYRFICDLSTDVTGSYTLIAEIQTEDDLWIRTYALTPKTTFTSGSFDLNFKLNTSQYENIVATIDKEIGITAKNPILIIRCEISISTETPAGFIYDSFTPSILIPLGTNIIEINNDLIQTETGGLTRTITVDIPEEDVSEERGGPLLLASVFFLPIIPIALFTQNDDTTMSHIQKQVKKILKKYGEWIVEVERQPKRPIGAESISVKSLDDLIKISEELGRPVIHYVSGEEETHTFHVLDENIHYRYVLD